MRNFLSDTIAALIFIAMFLGLMLVALPAKAECIPIEESLTDLASFTEVNFLKAIGWKVENEGEVVMYVWFENRPDQVWIEVFKDGCSIPGPSGQQRTSIPVNSDVVDLLSDADVIFENGATNPFI